MPAKSKSSGDNVKDKRPPTPTKQYIKYRWNVDAQFRLFILVKSDSFLINQLCWRYDAGRITGLWVVKRQVEGVSTRCVHFATDLLNQDGTDHKFQTNGLLLLPRLFKNFEIQSGSDPSEITPTFEQLAKLDKACAIKWTTGEKKQYDAQIGKVVM
jgi:hypothetical protein